eukprot:3933659-Amphidinium_carterae.1
MAGARPIIISLSSKVFLGKSCGSNLVAVAFCGRRYIVRQARASVWRSFYAHVAWLLARRWSFLAFSPAGAFHVPHTCHFVQRHSSVWRGLQLLSNSPRAEQAEKNQTFCNSKHEHARARMKQTHCDEDSMRGMVHGGGTAQHRRRTMHAGAHHNDTSEPNQKSGIEKDPKIARNETCSHRTSASKMDNSYTSYITSDMECKNKVR